MAIGLTGRIQTGSYTNKDGVKVYTTDIVVEDSEFVESKGNNEGSSTKSSKNTSSDDFMSIPDEIEEDMPFA